MQCVTRPPNYQRCAARQPRDILEPSRDYRPDHSLCQLAIVMQARSCQSPASSKAAAPIVTTRRIQDMQGQQSCLEPHCILFHCIVTILS